MKHEEIKGKIVAFMDGEVNEALKDEIVRHLQECKSCSNEYEALFGMDSYIKNTGEISPPAFFREGLMKKLEMKRVKTAESWLLKLIPASAVMAAFVLFVSAFLIISPVMYAAQGDNKAKLAVDSIKTAVLTCMASSVFSPAAFAAFCDNCSVNMCECCKSKDPNHKCTCGGHKHGK
jgi:hypothetical protein